MVAAYHYTTAGWLGWGQLLCVCWQCVWDLGQLVKSGCRSDFNMARPHTQRRSCPLNIKRLYQAVLALCMYPMQVAEAGCSVLDDHPHTLAGGQVEYM